MMTEKHFNVLDVVWARPRKPKSEVFWPAQVVETEKTPRKFTKKIIASVKFLGEDTYEDVKEAKDIMEWDCKEQGILIRKGRDSIKKPREKICFNKGVAEAKRLFAEHKGHSDKHRTLDKSQAHCKGNNSIDIKFVDENPMIPVVAKHSSTSTNENEKREETNDQKAPKNNRKRVNTNNSEEQTTNIDEPKIKRSKKNNACDSLPRRTSPRKHYGTDPPITKMELNKRKYVSKKEVADKIGVSTPTQLDDGIKNGRNCKDSPAPKRKRKTEKKTKQNGCDDNAWESKDEEIRNSKSSEKSFQKPGKAGRKVKLSENIQLAEQIVEKQSSSNRSNNGNLCKIEQENSGENKEELESDSCSDEELMETALSPNSKDLKFELNDIVWAKLYRDPFWPAQVKRITIIKKTKKIYVRFLGYDNETCFSCKKLVPFACDSQKREELASEADNYDSQRFSEAVTIAEDLVRRKALGIEEQNKEEDDDAYALVDADDVKEPLVETEEQPKEEITVTRKSTRKMRRPSKYKDILTYIREAKPFLKEIFEEKKPCERHQIFKKGSAKDKNSLKRRSGFGPVSESDLENDIMELLQEYYRELVGSDGDFSEVTYISDVWLPEAIIFALQKIENIDRKTAETMYQSGSSHETHSQRFTQRLKAKTLTAEEKEESVERAERALSKSFPSGKCC